MRRYFLVGLCLCFAIVAATCAEVDWSAPRAAQTPAPPPPASPPQTPLPAALPPVISTPQTAPAQPPLTIVIDAAHGGADNGARGPNGVNEKDVVLALARGCRAELTTRGYRVVMTRDSDADPTFDDRAALANQFADAIFISLHVASTGTPGTVRVYYDREASPYAMTPAPAAGSPVLPATSPQPPLPAAANAGLLSWRKAQAPFDNDSHRFADFVQALLAQKFSNSPPAAASAAVRDLRSIAAPAVAIEASNISSPNANTLESMGAAIAAAIAQGISEFRPAGAAR